MNKKNIIYIAAIALGISSLSVIVAEDETKQKFENLDSNGNGFISKSEATQNIKLREHWKDIDKNMDEKLTKKEFSKFASVPNEPYPE